MNHQWQELIKILPVWMRESVDRQGREQLNELRLRLHAPPELVFQNTTRYLNNIVTAQDLSHCVNAATKYSPWNSSTLSDGYITVAGGHRIGVFGECSCQDGCIQSIPFITSLCIRVAREHKGIAGELRSHKGSILIIGKPGSGKTTLLRDLIRMFSAEDCHIAVLDERRELFPLAVGEYVFDRGSHTDILSGCRKARAMEIAIRVMAPDVIAVDEITAEEDCAGILQAAWCGVRIFATAHAGSREELEKRKLYQPVLHAGIFDTLITLHPDKSWHREVLLCS